MHLGGGSLSRYEGHGRLERGGVLVAERVGVWIDDDVDSAPSYAHGSPHGEVWLDEGDLMSRLPADARCDLTLADGTALRVRVNSFDRGGGRAQVVVREA